VIRMRVGGEQAHRNAVMGALLDAPATEGAGGVAVNQQGQQAGAADIVRYRCRGC
jgi:hypothetical protein